MLQMVVSNFVGACALRLAIPRSSAKAVKTTPKNITQAKRGNCISFIPSITYPLNGQSSKVWSAGILAAKLVTDTLTFLIYRHLYRNCGRRASVAGRDARAPYFFTLPL